MESMSRRTRSSTTKTSYYWAIPPLGKPHDQIFKLYLTLKLWYHFEEQHLKL